jgi:hypothetical protein
VLTRPEQPRAVPPFGLRTVSAEQLGSKIEEAGLVEFYESESTVIEHNQLHR